jgi:hypothetical protein
LLQGAPSCTSNHPIVSLHSKTPNLSEKCAPYGLQVVPSQNIYDFNTVK